MVDLNRYGQGSALIPTQMDMSWGVLLIPFTGNNLNQKISAKTGPWNKAKFIVQMLSSKITFDLTHDHEINILIFLFSV
jgi:hypothetical protein